MKTPVGMVALATLATLCAMPRVALAEGEESRWAGRSSNGWPIALTLNADGINSVKVEWSQTPCGKGTWFQSRWPGREYPVAADGSFAIAETDVKLTGRVDGSSASGELSVELKRCGVVRATWSASRASDGAAGAQPPPARAAAMPPVVDAAKSVPISEVNFSVAKQEPGSPPLNVYSRMLLEHEGVGIKGRKEGSFAVLEIRSGALWTGWLDEAGTPVAALDHVARRPDRGFTAEGAYSGRTLYQAAGTALVPTGGTIEAVDSSTMAAGRLAKVSYFEFRGTGLKEGSRQLLRHLGIHVQGELDRVRLVHNLGTEQGTGGTWGEAFVGAKGELSAAREGRWSPGAAFDSRPAPSPTTHKTATANTATTKVVFRSIPAGSRVFVAPAADLGIATEPGAGNETVESRLLGTNRISSQDLTKLGGLVEQRFMRGKTPLELRLPRGTYLALVAPPDSSGNAKSKAPPTALQDYIEDGVLGPTVDVDLGGQKGRVSVFDLRGKPEEFIQLWQPRDASVADLVKLYPSGESYDFDFGESVSRHLEGNIPVRDVKPVLDLLRRGGKVVYRQSDEDRLVLQVDREAHSVSTVLRFRGWALARQGPPAAFPLEYRDFDPPPAIKTAFGPMRIQSIELSDRFPPACAGGPECTKGRNGEPMLVVWMQPDAPGAQGPLSQFDRGVYLDASGRKLRPTSSGLLSGKYFFLFLVEAKARSFRLVTPEGAPVTLSLAGETSTPAAAELSAPPPPPAPLPPAETTCFPPCRRGFACAGGRCVAGEAGPPQALPVAATCFPPCRRGFACVGGQCVSEAPASQPPSTVAAKPECFPNCRRGFHCAEGLCVTNSAPSQASTAAPSDAPPSATSPSPTPPPDAPLEAAPATLDAPAPAVAAADRPAARELTPRATEPTPGVAVRPPHRIPVAAPIAMGAVGIGAITAGTVFALTMQAKADELNQAMATGRPYPATEYTAGQSLGTASTVSFGVGGVLLAGATTMGAYMIVSSAIHRWRSEASP